MLRSIIPRASVSASTSRMAAFSTSAANRDVARMQLLGRLVADPEVKQTRSGKDYVRYTLATTDAPAPPAENGERPPLTTSYHRIFAFGENSVERLSKINKGTQVLVDADFRIERAPVEGGEGFKDNILVQHRSISVISRPKPATEA